MKAFFVLFTLFCLGYCYGQGLALNYSAEKAPCGGKGKIIFNALVPGDPYKISLNNGKSFLRTHANSEGELEIENIPGRYDIILEHESGRVTQNILIPSEGKLPIFSLAQDPSVCEEKGAIVVLGLHEKTSYRISINNGESYHFFTTDAKGGVIIPSFAGTFDVLVANNCGFSKKDITVGSEGTTPEFLLAAEPSQCGNDGAINISGLEFEKTYEISIDNGEHYSQYTPDFSGNVKINVKAGTYPVIVKTGCGKGKSEISVTSEGAAPAMKVFSELEHNYSSVGDIVFTGLEALILYQVSIDNGQSYAFVASDDSGEIRRTVKKGSYDVILKNKCGASQGKVVVGENSAIKN